MLKNITTDTTVNPNLSPEFIAALTQSCQDQIAHPRANFTTSLRDVAYIAFIASEQGHYQHPECRQLYFELAADDFQVPANHFSEFTKKLALYLDIAIENICILNQAIPYNIHYYTRSLDAIETLLGNASSAFMNAIQQRLLSAVTKFSKPRERIAHTPTQRLADQFTHLYKADGFCFGSGITQPAFIKQLIQLANESRQLCANEGDDAIHYQQFIYYSTLNCFERWNALRALSYGLARLIELVADTQDTLQRRDFFAHLEAILGKPVNLPTQQAA